MWRARHTVFLTFELAIPRGLATGIGVGRAELIY